VTLRHPAAAAADDDPALAVPVPVLPQDIALASVGRLVASEPAVLMS
jgi:hypothetical protein